MNLSSAQKIQRMIDDGEKHAHREGHAVRQAFLRILLSRLGKYPEFDALVDKQFSLFCNAEDGGWVDPVYFFNTVNNPYHRIRDRLISWYIDHPEDQSECDQ